MDPSIQKNNLVEVLEIPNLNNPILILSFDGWIDAAEVSKMTRQHLLETGVEGGQKIARFNTDRLLDHRSRRPKLQVIDGIASKLTWPTIELVHLQGIRETDICLLQGPEPDYEWKDFSKAVLSLCVTLGVSMTVGLGAYPAAVPHTRPTRLSCTASSREIIQHLEVVTPSIEIPAGIQAVIEAEVLAKNIPSIGLWAQVPHYLSSGTYPPAVLALLNGLTQITEIELKTNSLKEHSKTTKQRINGLVNRNSKYEAMVKKLEQAYDNLHDQQIKLPTGEDLAAELEAFLRTQDEL